VTAFECKLRISRITIKGCMEYNSDCVLCLI